MGSRSVLLASPPAASATAAAELGIEELCEELAVAGGRNEDWPAIRGGKPPPCPLAYGFALIVSELGGGPPMPGRLGRLKMEELPNIGLVLLNTPLAIMVAFGMPLRSGLAPSVGPEKFGCCSAGRTSILLKGIPFVTVVIVVFFSEIWIQI